MKIIFISSGQYPNGGAATNRHLAYSKGLIELGHDVEYILIEKQKWEEIEINFDKIKFTCVAHREKDKFSKVKKIKHYIRTISAIKNILDEKNKDKKISALILLDTSTSILIPLITHAHKIGLKVFHERTEYPFIMERKSLREKIDFKIYLRFVVKKFDGIYVINNALKKYFSKLTNSKIVIVNMIVDPSRFEDLHEKSDNTKSVITYCGSMDGDKDGVPILLKSFAIITNKFPSVTLQIIGSLENERTRLEMESLVQELKIESRVIFTGQRSREEMPQLLKDSDILALARPNNKQAEGGFPTKLGEYLAAGVPVVVTNVGEISLFLKDKINAFIAEPDSAEKFAEKLFDALSSEKRYQIGLEGKKLVYNEFNYLEQAKTLEKLLS